tara:strand:- start:340 stop:543 length:204 start_codon:yes stop_codon:yes gene_type:complete
MVSLLIKVSIFITNLEKKYLKKYGLICHNDNLCVDLFDTCDCEQRNVFRQTTNKIGNYIYRLERKVG